MNAGNRQSIELVRALGSVALLTLAYVRWLDVTNSTIVALSYLIVVLFVAASSARWIAVTASVTAMFCFNFYFLPPVGTLMIADSENWVALGAFLVVSVVASHLSAAVRASEAVRQKEALTSALLASISHDLRTPLTAIQAAAANLQSTKLAAADRHEQLAVMMTAVDRLNRHFQNILDLARIDAKRVTTEPEWVHPGEIIEAARAQVAYLTTGHVIHSDATLDAVVRLDPRLTATALAHVIENAAQYAPTHSTISIEASVTSDALTIVVDDAGPGIASDDLSKIFDRFYRGAAGARRASGTGMGLAIAFGLLAAQHGTIEAMNRPSGGARFTMVIPVLVSRLMEEASA